MHVCTYMYCAILVLSIFVYYREVLAQIDHGEFEGFEYVNPLLMSKVDDV